MGGWSMEHASDTRVLRCYFSTWALTWRAAILVVVGGVCGIVGDAAGGSQTWAGLLWLAGAVLGALAALRYIARIITRRPAVVVTPEWIESNALSRHVAIMWQEIAAMFPYTQSRNHYVAIIPDDREVFLSRLSTWQRFWARLGSYLTPAPLSIWTSALDVSPNAFWRQLVDYGQAHVPHFAEGLDHEEPARTAEEGHEPAPDTRVDSDHEQAHVARRARRTKSQREVWVDRLSVPATVVLVMVVAFPASLLIHQDNPTLTLALLIALTVVTAGFALAALPHTRMRGFFGWCAFVGLLSTTCLAIAQGWGNAIAIIYSVVGLGLFVAMIVFSVRVNRSLQRISSRDPGEP
ncbi:MAG TPA: STM3941 family protein [Ktedonobacterales bacterium]